jgi:predicted dehydrogenase
LPAAEPVPAGLDWNSWIGPQTMRDFSSAYVPFKWRGWWDFGCGALGDMACHNMDPAFDLLKLGLPVSIKAEASAPAGIAYPDWSIIEFKFPATPVCPKGVKLTWYDGKKLPPPPENAHPQFRPGGEGCMMIGSKMTVAGGSHAGAPYPVALTGEPFGQAVKDAEAHWRQKAKEFQGDNHYAQWVEAAKKGDTAATGSNFEYAVPMTQAILLGCIALRFPGRELQWDNQRKCFSNCPEANAWLKFKPRSGFRLSV